jgi:5,10-methenyltetrahydromethanopterin hydrogenase
MQKASLESLNELHDAVARQLKGSLDDPKVLSAAIKFLKDNDITADLTTKDEEGVSLRDAINKHLGKDTEDTQELTVHDMLALGV